MGSKEDKEFFWGFKSNVSFVLLILGAMVIGNLLYENYQSFVRDKQNEQRQEINKSKENKKKELESSEKRESEKIENKPTTKDDSPASNDENNATQYDEIKYITCPCGNKFKVSKVSTTILGVVIYYWKGGVKSCNERDSKEQANEEKKDVLHTLELAQTHTLPAAKYCSKECACRAYYYK